MLWLFSAGRQLEDASVHLASTAKASARIRPAAAWPASITCL